MFAPQPIVVRYGQDGSLAAGAAGAGAGENYARQKALDMQFINAEADRRQRAELAGQEAQANRLQLAGQIAAQRVSGNPTQTNSPYAGGPFQQAVQAAKQNAVTAAISKGEIDANDPTVSLALSSPDVGANQVIDLIEERKKTAKKTGDAADTKKAKAAFLASQPEDVKAQLSAYLEDDSVGLSQLRIAAQNITGHQASENKAERYLKVSGLETEMRRVSEELKAQQKQVEAAGGDVYQPPSAMNPTYADPNQTHLGGKSSFGFLGNIKDRSWLSFRDKNAGNLVSGGNKQAMQEMNAFYRLQAQYDALAQQRSAALAESNPKAQAENVGQMSDADLLKALGK